MDIKTMLGTNYREGMTAEELTAALVAVEVVTLSDHDRKVNEISQRNRNEAIEKLKGDSNFMTKLEEAAKAKILADANKTAEDKASEILAKAEGKLKEACIKTNKANARELFSKANISEAEYADFMDMLVVDDEIISDANVTKYIEKYSGALKLRENKLIETYKKAEAYPKQGGNEPTKSKELTEMSYTEALEQKYKPK